MIYLDIRKKRNSLLPIHILYREGEGEGEGGGGVDGLWRVCVFVVVCKCGGGGERDRHANEKIIITNVLYHICDITRYIIIAIQNTTQLCRRPKY